jgi:hypothetical protein
VEESKRPVSSILVQVMKLVDILSMVDLTSISAILAAMGVFVGVVFAILQLRDLVKTRQTDLIMRLYSTFGSKEFQEDWWKMMTTEYKDYNDFVKKYGLWNPEAGFFFEGVGVLLKRNLIDISLVDDLLSGPIKMFWDKSKPIVEDARKQLSYPQYGEHFEYLYNEMQNREQQLTTIQ